MTPKQMREYKASRDGKPWQYYTLSKQERAIWDKQERKERKERRGKK